MLGFENASDAVEAGTITLALLGALYSAEQTEPSPHFPSVGIVIRRLARGEHVLQPITTGDEMNGTSALNIYHQWIFSRSAVANASSRLRVRETEYEQRGQTWVAVVHGASRRVPQLKIYRRSIVPRRAAHVRHRERARQERSGERGIHGVACCGRARRRHRWRIVTNARDFS